VLLKHAYEPVVIAYVLARVEKEDRGQRKDLKNSAAQVAGCSPQAADSYIEKLASTEGPLEQFIDDVGVRYIGREEGVGEYLRLREQPA
jgi:hypothetical protein